MRPTEPVDSAKAFAPPQVDALAHLLIAIAAKKITIDQLFPYDPTILTRLWGYALNRIRTDDVDDSVIELLRVLGAADPEAPVTDLALGFAFRSMGNANKAVEHLRAHLARPSPVAAEDAKEALAQLLQPAQKT
jgi:hypothetical protein